MVSLLKTGESNKIELGRCTGSPVDQRSGVERVGCHPEKKRSSRTERESDDLRTEFPLKEDPRKGHGRSRKI